MSWSSAATGPPGAMCVMPKAATLTMKVSGTSISNRRRTYRDNHLRRLSSSKTSGVAPTGGDSVSRTSEPATTTGLLGDEVLQPVLVVEKRAERRLELPPGLDAPCAREHEHRDVRDVLRDDLHDLERIPRGELHVGRRQ